MFIIYSYLLPFLGPGPQGQKFAVLQVSSVRYPLLQIDWPLKTEIPAIKPPRMQLSSHMD